MNYFLSYMIASAYAQDLIPCKDGTFADPSIGCVEAPDAIINSNSSLLSLILKVADGAVTLVAGIAAAFLIYGGIRYALSLGNEEKIKEAKNILLWSVIGLASAILAKYIVTYVLAVITQ